MSKTQFGFGGEDPEVVCVKAFDYMTNDPGSRLNVADLSPEASKLAAAQVTKPSSHSNEGGVKVRPPADYYGPRQNPEQIL